MEVVIRKSNKFIGTTTVNELKLLNRYNITYYKILNNNRHMAIISTSPRVHNINSVTIVEKQKMPLWKQDMQIRMGRIPRAQETRKTFRVQQLTLEEASKYRIEVYEIA